MDFRIPKVVPVRKNKCRLLKFKIVKSPQVPRKFLQPRNKPQAAEEKTSWMPSILRFHRTRLLLD